MTFLTANNQRNIIPTTHFVTPCMTQSFHCPSSHMPHVTPPGFEPRPPAPLASILTTRSGFPRSSYMKFQWSGFPGQFLKLFLCFKS